MNDYLAKVNKILEGEPDPAFARRARIIFENLNLKGNEKVLEIGCGRGFYLKTLIDIWPMLEVVGVDLNERYLSLAKKFIRNDKVKLLKADATNLPFANKTFDRIIASEVLEHIRDDEKAISEMYRVLRPGGIAIVTVPNRNYPFCWDPLNWVLERTFNWHIPSNIWWLAGIWADHVRLYDEEELRNEIEKAGFKVKKIWQATHYCFPFSHFLLYGIGKNFVEKGLVSNMSRFSLDRSKNIFTKLTLSLIYFFDNYNNDSSGKELTSMNLIFKIKK